MYGSAKTRGGGAIVLAGAMTTAGGPLEGPGASLPVSTAQPPAELRGEGAAVQHPPARASPSGRVSSLGGRAAANLLLNFQYSERNRQQWRVSLQPDGACVPGASPSCLCGS